MDNKIACAEKAIEKSRVLDELKAYSPEVVSTIFIGLDTKASDIDIACTYEEQKVFVEDFNLAFSARESYSLRLYEDHAVGRFYYDRFLFEIYASKIPVQMQAAYRHYQVMQRLVKGGGERLKTRIRQLKESGFKTEPAICCLMGLSGEPYAAVLELERWSDKEIEEHVSKSL
ncbi:DUF4269 domain-containing protein [bacterium]|nr:DUF4269 domain-containing protein [bacterium]